MARERVYISHKIGLTCPFGHVLGMIYLSHTQNHLPQTSGQLLMSCPVAEENASYGPYLVGCGGARNQNGHLELDAAIMDGRNLDFGAVTGLQGVATAISVARDVMIHSEHNMLTGAGATSFAAHRGYSIDPELVQAVPKPQSHDNGASCTGGDTLGIVAWSNGEVCSGVTTSGKANKHPGRVGDSPLPGCGLYADNEGGAACCTGDGDEILKYCPSFLAVYLMRQGCSAQESCDQVMADIHKKLGQKTPFEFGMVAVDKKGNVGATTTISSWTDPVTNATFDGFPYTVMADTDSEPQLMVRRPDRR